MVSTEKVFTVKENKLFTLHNPDHTGQELRLYDRHGQWVAYAQWTTWTDYAEIDAIESRLEGCGRRLVEILQDRFDTLVLTSRNEAFGFWRRMGFKQDVDDPCQWVWKRGLG